MNGAVDALPLLVLILAADYAITLLHSYQEWKGAGAPLWRNFGAIVGLDIADRVGFLVFTLLLTLLLFAIGLIGILGLVGPRTTAFALGAVIGARLSDTLVSHLGPHSLGYRPNPGLSSTPLYVLEALFIAWFFHASLAAEPGWAGFGFALGILSFVVVLPGLWLARLIWPARQRPAWRRWEPIPSWAATNP
jgi:hypothetical protein